jgi:hypothetical protein
MPWSVSSQTTWHKYSEIIFPCNFNKKGRHLDWSTAE